MKKLSFLILIFVFTTAGFFGFFKSSLEKCADETILMIYVTPATQWKKVNKSPSDLSKDVAEISKIKSSCPSSGCNSGQEASIIVLKKKHKNIKVRDIPESEQLQKFNKFLKQSLKKKLQNEIYEGDFESCEKLKKKSPELFKAKYN